MYILRNKYIFFVKGLNVEHPSGGVLVKRCSEKMQQIYRRAPMQKCDFNKVALQLHWNTLRHSNFDEITLPHGCSLVNLLHIFRTPFTKNTSGGFWIHLWELYTLICFHLWIFHDVGPNHIETSPWTGFYIIGTSVMKELNKSKVNKMNVINEERYAFLNYLEFEGLGPTIIP